MTRKLAIFVSIVLCLALMPGPAAAGGPERFSPGSAGSGDPYFPLDGNGGYDVRHYDLKVRYNPSTDRLSGTATITARATKNLSKFNLDFEGLRVDWITVNGDAATWRRHNGELTVNPRHGLPRGEEFVTVVRYRGVPEPIVDAFGESGFLHTDDGALVIGEPHVADTWFPVNDHPTDKASYTLRITVPRGLKAISNGVLQERERHGAWTTWTWQAREPMASYLVGMGIGKFETRSYTAEGIRYWDAVDPDLFLSPFAPRTGEYFALSQQADFAYKRLARTISVPAEGADLSFWVQRDTEPGWDYLFVEAHTPGMDDWTTLPDLNGHATQDTGIVCPSWLGLHPFLTHYQTEVPGPEPACEPTGSSGDWWAASGTGDGYEQWTVDLSAWANGEVEVSLTYATDESVQLAGLFVDDIVVSTGEGTTSFEADGDVMDGWTTPGAPEDSPGNENDWIAGTVADVPPTVGDNAFASFDRQPEIISFEEGVYGPYPFSAAGGIVDDFPIGFALENQTRPIYSPFIFTDLFTGDFVVVHELAHQWVGDSLAVQRWRHIWLNEGFATYTEWLWSEAQGLGTAQEVFDFWYGVVFSVDDEFWDLLIGNPGPDHLFDFQVYVRGAMTLHQLRLAVGDAAFFEILERWGQSQAGGNVTTNQFIRLAERISGQELDELFETWLFTPERPVVDGAVPLRVAADLRDAPSAVRSMIERFKERPD